MPRRSSAIPAAFLLLLFLCVISEAADYRTMTQHYTSGGKKIAIEVFMPEGKGPHAAVMVLHGAGGIDSGNAYVRQFATVLAAQGCATFLPHYFDRTGAAYAGDTTIRRDFPEWLAAIRDALSFISNQAEVDQKRIACFGYSLGGYLALALASQDERVNAVIEAAGGVDESYVSTISRMPPVLILHGSADRRVPVTNAYQVEKLLKRTGTKYEMKIYEGEGHILSPASMLDAVTRSILFLQNSLGK
jgi:dienelactone hydrolase